MLIHNYFITTPKYKNIIAETYINICKDIYYNTQILIKFAKNNNIKFNTIFIFKEEKKSFYLKIKIFRKNIKFNIKYT